VTFSAKRADDGEVTAFIGQKPEHCRSYPACGSRMVSWAIKSAA
jgi:hypothetical protein